MNDALRNRVAEDMAVARSLAEEGRRAPLIGGAVYVVWGVAVALCLLVNWLVETRIIAVSYWTIPAVWFGGMGLAGVVTRFIRMRLAARPGNVGIGNTVTHAVWNASGAFLGLFSAALFLTLLTASSRMLGPGAPPGAAFGFAFSIFLPVSFGAYGVAMAASAAAAQSAMLRTFGWISFVAMIATIALIGRAEQMLVGAVAAVVVLVAPGVALMRKEPKA